MDCKACGKELDHKETIRSIDKLDDRCFSCIDKDTPVKETEPKKEEPEPKKEKPKDLAFPEGADRNPPPLVTPTIWTKETPPRFKLSANDTATGKWQISVTIEGPDYQVVRSTSDSDVGAVVKEPLAAIAMSMIHEMEVRLKDQGKTLADDPKEPKVEKVNAEKPKKVVKK